MFHFRTKTRVRAWRVLASSEINCCLGRLRLRGSRKRQHQRVQHGTTIYWSYMNHERWWGRWFSNSKTKVWSPRFRQMHGVLPTVESGKPAPWIEEKTGIWGGLGYWTWSMDLNGLVWKCWERLHLGNYPGLFLLSTEIFWGFPVPVSHHPLGEAA